MGVSSELVNGVLIFSAERKNAEEPIVALYYTDRSVLLVFSLPAGYDVNITDVLRLLKQAGYLVRERRHLWGVSCSRGQPFTIRLPNDQIRLQCRVPMYSALLDIVDEYNNHYTPDDGNYVSQLVTV